MAMSGYQKPSSRIWGKRKYKKAGGQKLKAKSFVLLAVFLLIMGGIFYFIFLSGYFNLINVRILGNRAMDSQRVIPLVQKLYGGKKFGIVNKSNYFMLSERFLSAEIKNAFPIIEYAQVNKVMPDSLEINIREREATGVWCADKCFYFDREGIIFEESPKTRGALVLSIQNAKRGSYLLGDKVMGRDGVDFFSKIKDLVAANFDFSVIEFFISDSGEVSAAISHGWRMVLNSEEDPIVQMSNLKYVLDEKIKTRVRELEYVDLRLGNRVYYKYRNY